MKSFFSSVRLTIGLLFLIALASLLGTVIPQREFSETFISPLSPGMVSLLQKLQLFDIYHSLWFIALMVLLSLNLIFCSLNRFPVAWKRFRGKNFADKKDIFGELPYEHIVRAERPLRDEAARLEGILRKRFRRVTRQEMDGNVILTGEKGNASYLGAYIIHVSILTILVGVIIGSLFGFEAYVSIPEGESVDTVALKGGKGNKKLDFSIRCDRFTVEHYEDGTPKEYRSELTFTKNGNLIHQGAIRVNHPATVEGIRFYQAHFGTVTSGNALLVFGKKGEHTHVVKVGVGQEFDLPGGEGRARVIRVEGNFMGMGPAVKMEIQASKRSVQFWVFQNIEEIEAANPGLRERVPVFNPALFHPYVFSLVTVQSKHYTGLQVSKDPGIPIVAGGAFLLVAGFMIVFFSSHRLILVAVECHGTKTEVRVTGRTNRDHVGLRREVSRLMDEIRKTEA